MNKVLAILEKCKLGLLLFLVYITPFYFFPPFQNYVQINMTYVLAWGGLIAMVISLAQLLISKKFIFRTYELDTPVLLFVAAAFLSLIVSSTNKIQSLLDPSFGLLTIVSLAVLYYYLSRNQTKEGGGSSLPLKTLSLSGFSISALIILLSLEPTKGVGAIPLTLILFIGFTFMTSLNTLVRMFSVREETPKLVQICMLIVISLALIISFFVFSKQEILFPSFSLSFAALFQVLKSPVSALFGGGVDNYSSIFNRVKDATYNTSELWQNIAQVDRSMLMHVGVTTGLAGLISFGLLLVAVAKKIQQKSLFFLGFVYVVCIIIFSSPSLLVFFLLFFFASQVSQKHKEFVFKLPASFSIYNYLIVIITVCVIVGGIARMLSTFTLADYYVRQSYIYMQANNLMKVYEAQQKALSLNAAMEDYHIGYANTHLVIANNIKEKTATDSATAEPGISKRLVLTKENRQMLIEAIQAAMQEAQIAISLNPKKAEYWAQLAQVYVSIPKELEEQNTLPANTPLSAALTSLKKAAELDPQNPSYSFQTAIIFLDQGKTDDGAKAFQKSIELKPNFAQAHFQLGGLYSQKQDIKNTIKEWEIALQALDPKKNPKDYDVVKQELEKIKASSAQQQKPAQQQMAPDEGVEQ